jgi:hypothetical protein
VPDNVLFEGGAGETIRRKLLHECDVHTLLRLPTGIFYAQGVKANVLFFDRKPGSETPWTKELWIYDLRTNQHFTLKTNPLTAEPTSTTSSTAYNAEDRSQRVESERFKPVHYDELTARDKASLDIFWLRDESASRTPTTSPPPGVIAAEIVEDLEAALAEFTGSLCRARSRAGPTTRSASPRAGAFVVSSTSTSPIPIGLVRSTKRCSSAGASSRPSTAASCRGRNCLSVARAGSRATRMGTFSKSQPTRATSSGSSRPEDDYDGPSTG